MGTFIDDNAGAQPSAPGELRATATEVSEVSQGAVETVETTVQEVDSHLDSFFQGSAWTREDIMVIAAMLQILAWVSLLYLEVKG